MPAQQATVEVITSSTGYLDAWIDFDADGNWTQTSDQIFQSKAIFDYCNFSFPGVNFEK
jgi:hypothetical protein